MKLAQMEPGAAWRVATHNLATAMRHGLLALVAGCVVLLPIAKC